MFRTVLVANRGEIAVRVIRTLRRLGVRSVAVHTDVDAEARHVAEADTAVALGPARAYLDIAAIVAAAQRTGAEAVHPGYGFLAENAEFAAALADAGIVFLGPPPKAIEVMGDKIAAKNAVAQFGVPVVPGIARPGLTDDELIAAAPGIGFPVLVKPSAGGGGKGMHRVDDAAGLPGALVTARREARAGFGDDTLFLERFVSRPRHIEVQVLADQHGHVVHLGERECSLQRRHQKVIEEAPSPLLDAATRATIGAAAVATARSVDYVGVGTVEFLVSDERPDEFFFMEMNTRLQVEHPVTEEVTGLDLVELQLRVGAGEQLPFTQDDVVLTGHSIEARVYAEDPGLGFLPTGGRVLDLAEPDGDGIRVDSGLRLSTTVSSDYDPMLAKIIASGPDRSTALQRLDTALAATAVLGVTTNVEFLRFLLADPDVAAGRLDTALLDRRLPEFTPAAPDDGTVVAAAASRWLAAWAAASDDPWTQPSGWRLGAPAATVTRWRVGDRTVEVRLTGTPDGGSVVVDGGAPRAVVAWSDRTTLVLGLDGERRRYRVAADGDTTWIAAAGGVTAALRLLGPRPARPDAAAEATAELASPMPGAIIAVHAADGDPVTAGAPVVVVEAMKMEHVLTAPADGTLRLAVALGDRVSVGQVLARVEAEGDAGGDAGAGVGTKASDPT
ncbi:biotin carboxylase N-terminal domain-containing protein [Cryptosporangium arvum]|uniref:biotin carboxylase n=1 Tax=Cryptosporangium arvum DSM 44712 TaxID=927661 RepID=A0A010ZX20_9ACTN|nr:biotin carboxylase N-terminal domain-containing protein [Cryptosporangium arvum]EXG81747.1 acetyl/propionyl-CoA carboxylase, alpha subunit [Cryptosporangium arvum DSM 44712]